MKDKNNPYLFETLCVFGGYIKSAVIGTINYKKAITHENIQYFRNSVA